MDFLVMLRMLRIFRFFHVLHYFKPLRILLMAMRASVYELIVLLVFCSMFTLIFATLIYYAEGKSKPDSRFVSIPIGLWSRSTRSLDPFYFCYLVKELNLI